MTNQTTEKSRMKLAAMSMASLLALSVSIAATPVYAQNDKPREISIEPMALDDAINAIADQSATQIVLYSTDGVGLSAPALSGAYTAEQALDAVLEGTALEYRRINDRTIAVGPPSRFERDISSNMSNAEKVSPGEESASGPFRVAQVDQGENFRDVDASVGDADYEQRVRAEEIIVTGTLLRGVNPTSPLIVFDREDIDAGGFASTQDLLRSLPQNFDQGQNTAGGRAGDTGGAPLGASAVNLRGLGNRSTLVLINGKRVAPGGGGSQFTDVNLIPLSAIERVEILTDGASATYGTDAVAGVINLILKEDFVGSETSARFGAVTEGSSQQYAINQTLGANWGTGSLLGSFEYFRQNNLDSSERNFSEAGPDPVDLIPKRETKSGFIQLRQNVSEQATLYFEGLFSRSEGESNLQFEAGPLLFVENTSDQYNITAGVEMTLPADWRAELYGTISRNEGEFFQSRDGAVSSRSSSKSDVGLIEARADGDIFSLPGGATKLAIGAQFRSEEFKINILNVSQPPIVTDAERDVYSVFAEMLLPVVGQTNRRQGIYGLEVSLSGRYEDYSDFGSTINPKIGLLYAPSQELDFRGTYGTSFIAPSFQQLFLPVVSTALPGFISPLPDGSAGPNYILLGGGNSNLVAEEAETWTVGFDARPSFIEGLRISGTYYNVEFTDRIGQPLNGSVRTLFTNPNTIDERFITFDPLLSEVEALFAGPFFQSIGGVTAIDIGALVDSRFNNIASTFTDGMDISIEYARPFRDGQVRFGLNGNYIFSSDQLATPTSEIVETINNFAQPVDLRLRGSLGWTGDRLSTSLFLNYVDGYSSDRVGDRVPVNSWTTIDYSIQYSFLPETTDGPLSGVRLGLNIQNLFDEDPPFVESGIEGMVYDGNNASPLGRFLSFELSKSF